MPEIRPGIGLPPNETVEFFRAKGEYPISRRWWDVWQEEHARAFTVAGITDRTILEETRASLDKVLAEGGTFEMWRSGILPDLKKAVGDGTAPLNILTDARLRTIYNMNLRMARAAGQWKRIEALKARAPFLMYSAVKDNRTRPLHRLWGGLDAGTKPIILPVDHPAWRIFYPPNGWGCRCNIIQLSQRDLDAMGLSVTTDAELRAIGWPTGETMDGVETSDFIRGDGIIESVPTGVDPGFAYNVGNAHMRGLVPIPAEGPISEPIIASGKLPALPEPRDRSSSLLMPEGIAYQALIDAFIDTFGTRNSAGAVTVNDAIGQPLVIDDSFFYKGGVKGGPDTEKLVDSDRRKHIRLMAQGLKDPDEIWYVWEEVKTPTGTRRRLTRRYIARFTIDGKTKPVVIVMDIGADGWKGITAITSSRTNYATSPKVRGGVLAYRRK